MRLLITQARIIDPASGTDAVGDLLFAEGRLVQMGTVQPSGDEQMISAAGLVACPGLVDLHVHFREPGQTHKETIATGAAAAAAGGFTTVVCETNTTPVIDNADLLRQVQATAAGAPVRVLFKHCLTWGQRGVQLVDLAAAKAAGAVAASDDGQPTLDTEVMRRGLAAAKEAGLPVTPHCEESPVSRMRDPWPEPYQREAALVERDLALAGQTGARLHVSHLSMAASAAALAKAKAQGWPVSAEVAPQHLSLTAEMAEGNTSFKTNPPLRSRADVEAMQQALAQGVIDCIATDHAPHAASEKALAWDQAPFGLIGLETALGVVLTELVTTGRMTLPALLSAMTDRPARLLGLPAGRLVVGGPADVCFLDPAAKWWVEPERFASMGRNCPWAGRWLTGRVVMTICRGQVVYRA